MLDNSPLQMPFAKYFLPQMAFQHNIQSAQSYIVMTQLVPPHHTVLQIQCQLLISGKTGYFHLYHHGVAECLAYLKLSLQPL